MTRLGRFMQGARRSRGDWHKDGKFSAFVCRFSTNLHPVCRTIIAIVVEMSRLHPPPVWDGRAVQSSAVQGLRLYAELPEFGYVSLGTGLEQFLWSQLRRVHGLVVADIYAILR